MRAKFGKFISTAILLGLAISASPRQAAAADLGLVTKGPSAYGRCSDIVFVCENGREYPLCPIAVTVAGEVVTASFHSSHVRLIPMGVGYRYAGHGIWLDGFRQNALLNFGKHSQVACTLQQY